MTGCEKAAKWLDLPYVEVHEWSYSPYARDLFKKAHYVSVGEDLMVDDLTKFHQSAACILLRCDIRNYLDFADWKKILTNAVECFSRRMAVVLFVSAWRLATFGEIDWNHLVMSQADGLIAGEEKVESPEGLEWIFYLERKETEL